MDNPQEVRELLVKHGLAEKADALMALARPSIRIFTQPGDDAELPVGVSKIGGEPDLPPGFEWPMWGPEAPDHFGEYDLPVPEKVTPLGLLAQFNLAEVAPYDVEHLMPSGGMLYFFYDGVAKPWHVETMNGGAYIYYYDGTDVRRTPAPENLPQESRFKSCSVTFKTELTLPSGFSVYPASYIIYPGGVHFSKAEFKSYARVDEILYENTQTKYRTLHRLLGYAQFVNFSEEPPGWRLLLQVDSDDHAEMMWGDIGKLYFWLPEEALAARRFDEWQMELVCN